MYPTIFGVLPSSSSSLSSLLSSALDGKPVPSMSFFLEGMLNSSSASAISDIVVLEFDAVLSSVVVFVTVAEAVGVAEVAVLLGAQVDGGGC